MQRASDFFTKEQQAKIEQAVAEAESKTSAEIVPVVSAASGRYDRAEDVVGLWTGLILMGLVWWWFPKTGQEAGSWAFSWSTYQLPILIAAVVIGFIVGAVAGTHIGWLRHLFTPKTQMRDEVSSRARQAFFDNRIHRTAGATGLLLYISLYERMAAIIADETVTAELSQGALDELCNALTNGLRTGDAADTVCAVLADAGNRLGKVLPIAEDDANELPNSLVMID